MNYAENCCHLLLFRGSAKSLYYLKEGLKHKALVVTEAFQFQSGNAADSEFVYTIRTLLSENKLCYSVAQKDGDGNMITVEKKIDGPTSFITTTVMENLEAQFDDRLFTIHPDESIEQTRDIITMTANIKAGLVTGFDKKTIDTWKTFHSSLKPVAVIIPYAPKISKYVNEGKGNPITARRAISRVMVVIQSVACAYQHQRKRDDQANYTDSNQITDSMTKALFIATGLYLHNYSAIFKEIYESYNMNDKEFISSWCELGRELMK